MEETSKHYILSVSLYDVELGLFEKVNQKTLKLLKRSAGEGWRRLVGPIV
jgi:hypothetical protein